MKVTQLFFFIGTLTYVTSDRRPFAIGGLNLIVAAEAIRQRCTDANQTNHFTEALNHYRACTNKTFRLESPHPVDEHQEFCKYTKESQLDNCMKDFTTKILPCLDKTEIYLPNLLLNSAHSFYDTFCGENGLSNTKYIFQKGNSTGHCILITLIVSGVSGTCISNLNMFKDLDRAILNLSKHNVCLDLESLKKCSTEVLEYACKEDFSRYTNLIFRPILEQC